MYLTETGQAVEKIVNIPDKNTAFILLGKGTSITDAAARKLAESNIVLGFCGSGGSPIFGMTDISFLVPQDEYRPTEYMQAWAKLWFDERARLHAAKAFLSQRVDWVGRCWPKSVESVPKCTIDTMNGAIDTASGPEQLLAAEAHYAKSLYASLAGIHGVPFLRESGRRANQTVVDRINSFLDHGNYIAYGYAACALHVLGISYSFPVLHGKTRRGALVFDVADLVKDWLVMPAAFECGVAQKTDNDFRAGLIEHAQNAEVLDMMITFVKSLVGKTA